jgi:hypothetical protein
VTTSQLAKSGTRRVLAGIGIMFAAMVVAYLGGAVAPNPELVNKTAENWTLVLILVGIYVDLSGVVRLQDAERGA